jgi:hypothetical protein
VILVVYNFVLCSFSIDGGKKNWPTLINISLRMEQPSAIRYCSMKCRCISYGKGMCSAGTLPNSCR